MKRLLFLILFVFISLEVYAQMNMADVAAYISNLRSRTTTLETNVTNLQAGTTALTVLNVSSITAGVDTFATTAATDTVLIAGAGVNDLYLITGKGGSVDQQDILQAEPLANKLVVHRLAEGASGLVYFWLRIKR